MTQFVETGVFVASFLIQVLSPFFSRAFDNRLKSASQVDRMGQDARNDVITYSNYAVGVTQLSSSLVVTSFGVIILFARIQTFISLIIAGVVIVGTIGAILYLHGYDPHRWLRPPSLLDKFTIAGIVLNLVLIAISFPLS